MRRNNIITRGGGLDPDRFHTVKIIIIIIIITIGRVSVAGKSLEKQFVVGPV